MGLWMRIKRMFFAGTGAALDKISAAANRLGAWLVTQCGATPPPDRQLLDTVARMLE